MSKPKKKNYLNNKDMLEQVLLSKQQDEPTTKLASMFVLLVERYSRKPNFFGYTYLEDMKGDALLSLCARWHKFDETRFSNAFAYFTQIIHNSFIGTLKKETRQRDIRDAKLLDNGAACSWTYTEKMKETKIDD